MGKSIIIIIVLNFVTFYMYGQVVSGTVINEQTKDKIEYAVVYIDGTFTGVYTDSLGHFGIDISRNINMPITIRALGFQTMIIDKPDSKTCYDIYLTPKIYTLDEVTINYRDSNRARTRNMRQFKQQFLGQTQNANFCEILNEEDIYFFYDSDNRILNAYSVKPITILNKGLGYKLSYFLDKFEFHEKDNTLIITGNIKFEEDMSKDSDNNRYKSRRISTYEGSRLHFFRSLWNNELTSAGFEIYNKLDQKLSYDSLVIQVCDSIQHNNTKYLKYNSYLNIFHSDYKWGSFAVLKEDSVYFEENGYYDILDISWSGEMSKQRISDQLPYDYIFSINH